MAGYRQQLGGHGEQLAQVFLQREGYQIVASNFRCPVGELDLIAIDGSTLVFIEVKARTGSEHGHPLEAITRSKQRQISRAAQYYLRRQRLHQALVRFDVVAITWSAQGEPIIELVKDAFPVM